jgi:hypothetical protein
MASVPWKVHVNHVVAADGLRVVRGTRVVLYEKGRKCAADSLLVALARHGQPQDGWRRVSCHFGPGGKTSPWVCQVIDETDISPPSSHSQEIS